MSLPRATYRLQFNRDFTFAEATGLVDYLAALGISHLYASPFLKARPGSTHGYDITDHNALNPEVGSEPELITLSDGLAEQGIGLVLDFVPNHMGVGGKDNEWWLDVLEWGRSSPYADYFDIEWEASRLDLRGKVLLPVLGEQYGAVLESGDIVLRFDAAEGSFSAWYHDHRFPISPRRYANILRRADLPPRDGGEELRRLVDAFSRLREGRSDRRRRALRNDGIKLKAQLADLVARHPELGSAIDGAAAGLKGQPGVIASWRPLHLLLEAQAYRLAYWRVASDEINYRRFFNINDLAGIRIELPELFDRAHRLVLSLVAQGRLHGLRIDHIDGLFDPKQYCERLQQAASHAAGSPEQFYILVEKILAPYEALRDWPIAGTTGYDFINEVGGLFVDPAGEAPLTGIYRDFTGRNDAFEAVLDAGKRRVTDVNLASEVSVLAGGFHALSVSHWATRDFTLNGMRAALQEVITMFPVYRTYVTTAGAASEDRRYIDWAVGRAKRHWPGTDTSIFDFLHSVLTGDLVRTPGAYQRRAVQRLAMKFQQLTGPVMAKGAEDTAFYRYARLLCLNEVGGDPARFGTSVAAFHHQAEARAKSWPAAMLAGSTHDTKRGEDGRARLALLSEMPAAWEQRLALWSRANRGRRSDVDGVSTPDPNDEYFFYQTVVAAWPLDLAVDDVDGVAAFAARVQATMVKMVREAKEQSSWSNPNVEYEAALGRFVAGALDASRGNSFLQDIAGFVEELARPGTVNSLAQTLIRLTAPGVPDIYQGAELWDFSMVDPDNRRPVDWAARLLLLDDLRRRFGAAAVDATGFADLASAWRDGREKLFLIWRALQLRATAPVLFAAGSYRSLETSGRHADHLCAFTRQHEGQTLLVAVPRLVGQLMKENAPIDWSDTAIERPEAAAWRDALAGTDLEARTPRIAAGDLFRNFPVALLIAA
jgi:(1->4)-alpha-D-glucan 1-alpha-D-glucosylmutase